MLKKSCLMALLVFFVPALAAAQSVTLSSGIGFPTGEGSETIDPFYAFEAGLYFPVQTNVKVGASFSYNRFKFDEKELGLPANASIDGGGIEAVGLVGQGILALGNPDNVRFNLTAGAGGYALSVRRTTISLSSAGTTVTSSIPHFSETDFGLNFGGGIWVPLGSKDYNFSVQGKYHIVFTEGGSTKYFGFLAGFVIPLRE